MSSAQQSVAILMLVCTAPMVGLAAYAFTNLTKPGARGFLLCQVGAIGWSVQLAVLTWPTRLMPVYLNTTGRMAFQFLVIFGWPLLVWEYVNRGRVHLRRRSVAALLVVPAVTLALAATNPRHHLVLAADSPPNPSGISAFVLGPWYLVFISFAVIMTMVPAGYLLYKLRGAHGTHRKQLLLVLGGFLVGFPGALQTYIFRNVELVPLYVDLTPLSFAAAAVLWGLALFRYNLFGMVPVSRRTAVETMDDPLVSVDADQRVVDANPAAQALFGVEDVVGTELETFCSDHPTVYALYEQGKETSELTLETGAGPKHFVLDIRPIEQGQSERGSLLVLQDVTRLREREEELDLLKQVLSRVLRHNIRNDVMVIQAHAAALEDADENNALAEHTDGIFEKTEQMLERSEKATNLQDIFDTNQNDTSLDLTEVIHRQVATFREDHPGVDIETDLPESATVCCHPNIGTALAEALDNASSHFERDDGDLRVAVSVRRDDGEVVLTIEDNGPGVHESEIETLEAGEETALQHSSGVGLWMMQFIARKSGGGLAIGDATLGGAAVVFRLPAE